jgi:hypothetical protein
MKLPLESRRTQLKPAEASRFGADESKPQFHAMELCKKWRVSSRARSQPEPPLDPQ